MAEPIVVATRISAVSVFRAGAVVLREAELPGGTLDEVALDGLPLCLEDDSVRVRIEGTGKLPRPTDVRVTLVVPPVGESLTQAELQAARDEVERLTTILQRIQGELASIDGIHPELPPLVERRPPRPTPSAAWLGAIEWSANAKAARVEERARVSEQLRRAQEALSRLERFEGELAAARDARAEKVRKCVVVRLRDGEARGRLVLEYRVPGATWRPTYSVRMARDGQSALLSVRALVVQQSGEPWDAVKLSLSTADLLARAEIPELKSLRIGRKQPEPPRRAWRELPAGLDALFDGVDRALSAAPRPDSPTSQGNLAMADEPVPPPRVRKQRVPTAPMEAPELDEITSTRTLGGAPSMAQAAPMAPPAPMASGAARPRGAPPGAMAKEMKKDMARRRTASVPVAAKRSISRDIEEEFDEAPPETDEEYGSFEQVERHELVVELRYTSLVMSSWREPPSKRGKLRSAGITESLEDASARDVAAQRIRGAFQSANRALAVAFPPETDAVEHTAGVYDHRYDAEGPVDVPCDGKLHSVPLFGRRAPVSTTLIVVPRESTQAVRVATLKNPLAAPLLAGPAEIYLEDEFLVTSPLRTVPAGAELQLGLGIEEALKVARNVHFDEEKAGLLNGSTTLEHRVEIELAWRRESPVAVEVRERVPIKDDKEAKDLEVLPPKVDPPWESFDQAETSRIEGGKRWRFTLAPNASKKLAYSYTVKIDAKSELVGGNRRER